MKHSIRKCVRYYSLTDPAYDCRQPNWSPQNDKVLYQRLENGKWDIWTMDIYGEDHQKITSSEGDNTDAVFSGDGEWIIYSTDTDLEYANIFKISLDGGDPIRLTNYNGYDGAPSVSLDASKLVFESSEGYPEDSDGTGIWMKDF